MKVREIVLWAVAVLLAIVIWRVADARFGEHLPEVSFTEFMHSVDAGRVATVSITGNEIRARSKDDGTVRTYMPSGFSNLVPRLMEKGVTIEVKPESSNPWLAMGPMFGFWLLSSAVPIITLVLVAMLLREIHALRAKIDRLLGGGEPPDES